MFGFQNVEEVIKLLDKLTPVEKLELAKRIYIGKNQFDFIDSKGHLLDELDEKTDLNDLNNFYKELGDTFIKIYNTHKKVEKYLIHKLYDPCEDFNINNINKGAVNNINKGAVNKINNFQDLDDECAEIFEY